MPVDLYCSRTHYAAHARPVFDALDESYRGTAYSMRQVDWWASTPFPPRSRLWPSQPVLVASYVDARRCVGRPTIMVEHGAGQAYQGDPRSVTLGSYSGGDGLDHVVLFICPNESVAERWRVRYPEAATAVVGCPFLDRWIGQTPTGVPWQRTVALTWHWDADFVPEMRWAYPHYRDALPGLVRWANAREIRLLGHAHPRAARSLARHYAELGIIPVASWVDVIDEAAVLVADNTSAMWEWCALDRPLVVLDAPWYRRDVDHGLRFWTHADAGIRIGEPADLISAVEYAVTDPYMCRPNRWAAADACYAHLDGQSAARAAAAVQAICC